MPPDHDRLFKTLLRTFFSSFLRLVVPHLAGKLDAARAVFLDKELLAEEPVRGNREADLLARVPVRNGRAILVHIEIEARASPQMADRLLSYAGLIQAAYGARVLSILVNISRGEAGIRSLPPEDNLAAPELSTFRYTVFGLEGCPGVDYLAKPEPVAWALAALMSPGEESRAAYKLHCQSRIVEARMAARKRILLLDFVEAYLELTPPEAEEYKILSTRHRRRTRAMWMTWSERLKEEGKKEGLRLGKQEGRKLGQQEGLKLGKREGLQEAARSLQQVLLSLLDQRFGPLPESIHRQVEAISSLRRLTRLAEQVLTVGSIRELRLR
ncbi:MAG TPA: Rpn family recombination-promoting nuclease/putative transposase [Thermoanaerobaculia bacterium]|jgi:hypothetical protein|nr:Rpn family recombination-promoting nuclease/putative transposase [Thermoanaerobaculia bacterium]